jgi:hypothetical protein
MDLNGYLQVWISMDTCKYGFQGIPASVDFNGYLQVWSTMYQYGYEVLMDTCVYGDDMDACMSLKVDGSRSLTRQVLRPIEGRRQLSMFGIVPSTNISLLSLCWFFGRSVVWEGQVLVDLYFLAFTMVLVVQHIRLQKARAATPMSA